jgi:DNA-damage-inducible protein J
MTDCVIRSRIDPVIKEEAIELFETMGLTLSEAIRLFVYQSVAEHRIPFSINVPNLKTRKALKNARNGKEIKSTTLSQLNVDWDEACEK